MKKRFPWTRIDPSLPPDEYDAAVVERIRGRVKVLDSGCWEYLGTQNALGYGQAQYRGKVWPAHRLMHILVNGPIPDDYDCCHICDFPPCCNPAHTFPDTHQNNILQSVDRGRHHKVQVTHCPRGHEHTQENTYVGVDGWRSCKACMRGRHRVKAGWPEDLAYSLPAGPVGYRPHDITYGAPKLRVVRGDRTHCLKGHELTDANVYVTPTGYRQCRPCRTASVMRFGERLAVDGEVKP